MALASQSRDASADEAVLRRTLLDPLKEKNPPHGATGSSK
jgi:hypothetical protein